MISVENGQATNLASLEEHVRSDHVEYPVLHDADAVNTSTYGVRAFPSAFVLNKNGRVVWEGVPMGPGIERAQAAIEKALGS